MKKIISLLKKNSWKNFKLNLSKILKFVFRESKKMFEEGLFYLFWWPLKCLPVRTIAKLKSKLSKFVKLDSDRHAIYFNVDSELDIRRSKACSKEPETVKWIEYFIKQGDVFYDIGANVGAYSLLAYKQCKGEIIIHAFEPSFSTYNQLCRNILINHCQDKIFAHMIALSKESGISVFNYCSLEAGASLHALGANIDYKGDPFIPVYSSKVLSFSIDDLIDKYKFPLPNHIKLDVDGTEMDILYGAWKTLEDKNVKSVIVELCESKTEDKVVTDFLSEKGLKLFSKINHGDGKIFNLIFER